MIEKPFLNAFFFCERVLQEADGVPSAIRIVDLIGVQAVEKREHTAASNSPAPLMMFIAFKNDAFQGSCDIEIVAHLPSGAELSRNLVKVAFEPYKGTNLIIEARLAFPEVGTYWFELRLDGQLVTKTPLIVSLAPSLSAALADLEKGRSPSARDDGRRGE